MPFSFSFRSVTNALLVAAMLVAAFGGTCALGADEDYYDVLMLEKREDSAERDIKTNWRRLSKKYHPDLVGEGGREEYQKIQRAYEVLGDRKKRKVYDIRGEEGVKQFELGLNQPSQQMDPFAQLFGGFGGMGGGQGGAKRGSNVNMLMLISLEDVYNGAAHTVKLSKQKICRACRGTGAHSKEDLVVCRQCQGKGVVIKQIQIMPGISTQQQAQCPKCAGKGKIPAKPCAVCKGTKVTKGTYQLGVDIEQGTPENFDLVYDMEADQNPDEIPGDVIFTVQTAPHKVFTRKGNNLEMFVDLDLKESLLGFIKNFPHLDGHEVELEEYGPIQHGQTHVLEDEGMPVHHVPSEKGKLTVTYRIKLPEKLSPEAQEKIKAVFE